MRTMAVVVTGIAAKDPLQMPSVYNEEVVETARSIIRIVRPVQGPDRSFGALHLPEALMLVKSTIEYLHLTGLSS